MTRVLVTGGAGFIGSHLVERLLREGHDVTVVDDLSTGRREHLKAAPAARLLVADVRELARLEAELSGTEIIFHLAGLISGQDSLREPASYVAANVMGTLSVIESAARVGARRVVFASSSTVYGDAPEPERRETTLPEPLTPYALSKRSGEHLLSLHAPRRRLSHVSLRLFNVYGPRQNPNHPYANVTCKLAHAATTRAPVIDVYGDGHQTRDFVYVTDVVDAFMAVAFESKQTIYNVGSGESHSINELIALVERISGARLARRQRPPWPSDIRSIRADIQRLASDHGYAPVTPLEHGLARTVAYFRDAL